MRSGAAHGHVGYFHETAFYGSDEEFVSLVVPFVRDGLEAGEPTVVACSYDNEKLVREAVGDVSGIDFLPGADQYSRPTSAIKRFRDKFASLSGTGAPQIRVIGDVPHPGTGAPWDWWARYEAAVNRAFDEFQLWGLCPYDTRTTPAEVLADVERTHPVIASADGRHVRNSRFVRPEEFFVNRGRPRPDVLEQRSPSLLLIDPSPSAVRRAVRDAAAATTVSASEVDDLVFAASEAVTNGLTHGCAPVRFRLWADADHLVLTVTDGGSGPVDPTVGLVPTTKTATAGLGLWLTYQTCSYVTLDRHDDGFTVRVVAGPPRLAD
ncbi:anti-sigma factor RsbA family regulatory protein [Umezawaea sp. Da 62-37]|uniref:anti-sigma factor RsbA family regulatory protein n=1 Tax=Umezawaea sp. Da 62-37 TaxID=3075927 RepID=UPI0028F6F6E0|nr:anti-sigma factor RsbA family regulatory protein [Umezawaea sp. Da 62-37]WNV88141.1 anti-sigma factor RsbA family regulatory protein [Umezawaea sp. Da 62-37]